MYLTTFDPFLAELDRRAFGSLAGFGRLGGAAMPMDVVRREADVLLRFDVPGIDPDSIEVTVDRGVLTVSAKREAASEDCNDRFFVKERRTGTFTRRVRLSDTLDADGVEASYANGLLEVRVPVQERAKARKVEIHQAGQKKLAA